MTELFPPRDTVLDFGEAANENRRPFFDFIDRYNLRNLPAGISRGVTTADGRRMDVINAGEGAIRLEYDFPIVIEGVKCGWTRYDLVFSEVSGDCIVINFRDEFYFDTATPEGIKKKIGYCTKPRHDWKSILNEFERAFGSSNLY